MKRDEALKLLGLEKCVTTLTPEIVQTAFRRAVVENHPDKGGEATNIGVYQTAKKVLLDNLVDADSTCKLCGGLGTVRGTMGHRACVACSGTGVRR